MEIPTRPSLAKEVLLMGAVWIYLIAIIIYAVTTHPFREVRRLFPAKNAIHH